MLNGKKIVVIGGLGLIGRTFVRDLQEKGARILVGDMNKEAFKSLGFSATDVKFCKMDITSKESILNGIKSAENALGRVDAMVNCSYPRNDNYGRHFFDVDYDDFCENINSNIGGYFLASQNFAAYFIKNGILGNIVNISSIYGVVAPKFEIYENTPMTLPVEYAATKSALVHLTRYMAKYFKGKVRVNCICPGGIKDSQPQEFLNRYNSECLGKGMLDAEDLSGALTFLLSDSSKFINGQSIIVDDGFTL